jgi:N utilization substance protein B
MTTRRRAREIVLQMLYEEDLHPEQDTNVADHFLVTRLHGNRPLVEFARKLFRNILTNRKQIDKALSAKAANWSLRRMAAIDRNILRMGAYEILMSDTPGRVVINEAVELAKRYGDRQSGQFVNGILDRLLHNPSDESQADASSSHKPPNDPTASDQLPAEQASHSSSSEQPASNDQAANGGVGQTDCMEPTPTPAKQPLPDKPAEMTKQRSPKLKVATAAFRS